MIVIAAFFFAIELGMILDTNWSVRTNKKAILNDIEQIKNKYLSRIMNEYYFNLFEHKI